MRVVKTLEEFVVLNHKKHAIIYGAGWGGRTVYRYMKAKGLSVEAFAVTDAAEAGKSLWGVPVYCIEDVSALSSKRDMQFILAVTRQNQPSMEEELNRRGIGCYLILSDALLYVMCREEKRRIAREAQAAQKSAARGACQVKDPTKREEEKTGKTVGYLVPGYLDTDYAEERLIVGKIKGAAYIPMPKETFALPCIGTRYEEDLELHRKLSEACYCPEEYVPEVEVIHTFNAVCKTDKPWCASFETSMPRVWPGTEEEDEYFYYLAEYMKKPNCKRLYALSQNAYEIQESILSSKLASEDVGLIMKKTEVLHPPQKVLVSEKEFEQKHRMKKIHFIFIGGAFFIKGGRELLQVLSEFENLYDFKLTLISSLLYNDYFTHTPYEEMAEYRDMIRRKAWIDYYETLPNEKVLEKCREAHVGLLPSVADTYGYSVLEMQAAGCPVVTTNVRALPEINNEECGWICRLPVNRLGFCEMGGAGDWPHILREELRKSFQEIFDSPEKIQRKGKTALERVRRMHDPDRYQEKLQMDLFPRRL